MKTNKKEIVKRKKISIDHKTRLYAGFQMISTLAFMTFLVSVVLVMYNGSEGVYKIDKNFMKDNWKDLLTFNKTGAISKLISALIYSTVLLLIVSWVVGWSVALTDYRNYYDQMFLMFLLIPFISSIFCLIAQLKIRIEDYKSSRLSKEDIKVASKKLEDKIKKLKDQETKTFNAITKK